MRRVGVVASVVLVLGAIGTVAILCAVYGVGCFQLRRPEPEMPAVVTPARVAPFGTSVEPSPIVATDVLADAARAVVETPPALIVLAGTVVDVGATATDSRAPVADVAVRLKLGVFGNDADYDPVQTNSDGTFRLEVPDPGKRPLQFWFFVPSAGTQRNVALHVILEEGRKELLDLLLERFPMGDLIGTTVDPKDRPIAGVHVTAEGGMKSPLETDSDGNGRFRFADFAGLRFLNASHEGYVLLFAKNPVKIREGGWEPLRVVLAPTSKLRVRVLDEKKQGMQRVRVEPDLSPWEKVGPKPGVFDFRQEIVGVTDADGRVTLDVWGDQRLEIRMNSPDHEERLFECESEGVLELASNPPCAPIILHAGEERELTAIIGAGLTLRGHVVDETGQPVHPAFVLLEGPGGVFGRDRLRIQHECDEGGGFAFEIPPGRKVAAVRLRASTSDFSFTGDRIATLDVDLQAGSMSDLVLTLHPALRIAGQVLAFDGTGVSAEVVARLRGEPSMKNPWGNASNSSPDGSFVINGLEPGTYDLSAHPRETYRDAEMRSVEAGADGLKIVLDAKRPAHVTIEARGSTAAISKWSLWNARVRPFEGSTPQIVALAAEAEFKVPGNLPRVGLFPGGGAFSDAIGITNCSVSPEKGSSTQLDLDEGFYWFGAKGTDAEGHALFPVGTGLVRIDAGEHRIRFVLTSAIPVEGRLVGGAVLDLEVGIATRGGGLFELEGRNGETRTSRPVGADGSFSFAAVPVGESELWVGTAEELAAGKPARRQAFTVDAKGVPFLEISVR